MRHPFAVKRGVFFVGSSKKAVTNEISSQNTCVINKSLLSLQCDNKVTEMFDLVEGLNDREEMLDHLRFLIRYEEKILEDEMIFTKSEFYEELHSTIVMIADDLRKD